MMSDHSHSAGAAYLARVTRGWFPLIIVAAALLGIYLFVWHQAHLFSMLPLLIILACPLMHFFGHGHGHKHGSGE
jgi:hypothetical protein